MAEPSLSVTHVESCFASGAMRATIQTAQRLLDETPTSQERMQLRTIQGMAAFELGDAVQAHIHLVAALDHAAEATRQNHFKSALALFSRVGQFQSPAETLPALTKLRQLASATGDPNCLGYLHLGVARFEAFRGLCISARRHLELSRKLFSRTESAAIPAAVHMVDSGLEMFGGNLERARRSALVGLDLARSQGLALLTAGCLTNLGTILIAMGRESQAKQVLENAVATTVELRLIRFSALDALAVLAMQRGVTDEVTELLGRCARTLNEHKVPCRSWYDLAHQLTRCSYYERLGDVDAILTICDAADGELERREYRAIRTSLLCFRARALSAMGRHDEAQEILGFAVRCCPRGALDPLIVLEASRAICQAARGDLSAARTHFSRSLAASRATGHALHMRWIEQQEQRIEHAHRGHASLPSRGTYPLQDTALLLSDISTILGAGHSIDLLAHRTAALLHATTLGPRVDVDTQSGCEYQAEPTAVCETTADGGFEMRLRGSDRRVTITVKTPQTLEELSLLKSLADVVQTAVHRAAGTQDEDDEDTLWPRTLVSGDEDTVFRSPRMVELLKVAVRLASTNLPVLITGETGTGKEIFARLIHDHSKRKRGPFVPFNCSALPRELVESQLFGHRRGAFTGATEPFAGLIRAAEQGTLFLDEVADLDVASQPKLLRFLESGEIHPLGELRPLHANVRVVAATNADVEALIAQGRFRADLFYRLGATRLSLPPLRERKDEIPALAAHFLARYSRECDRTGVRLADDFVAALLLYQWPGNIRELANEIRRAVAMAADGDTLTTAELTPQIAEPWNTRPVAVAPASRFPTVQIRLDQTLPQAVDDLEQQFIEHALAATDGRVTDAAQLLGVSRKGLFLKRRRRGLVPAADNAALEA